MTMRLCSSMIVAPSHFSFHAPPQKQVTVWLIAPLVYAGYAVIAINASVELLAVSSMYECLSRVHINTNIVFCGVLFRKKVNVKKQTRKKKRHNRCCFMQTAGHACHGRRWTSISRRLVLIRIPIEIFSTEKKTQHINYLLYKNYFTRLTKITINISSLSTKPSVIT